MSRGWIPGPRGGYSVEPASSTGGTSGGSMPPVCSNTISPSTRVHDDRLAGAELLVEELLGERVLDQALDRAAQRPGAERLVVALLWRAAPWPTSVSSISTSLAFSWSRHPLHHEVDDVLDVVLGERAEHDDLVDPVDELGPEATS